MRVDAPGSHPTVTGAIRQAAHATGTSFQYLLATAQVESGFNPGAAASTSSARGLFQFVEQTWLTTLKEQGPALGYGQLASAITRQPSGKYAVADPQAHRQIMNLRSDPTVNAVMAGAFTRDNAAKLTARIGRSPTEGELYLAHFLGAAGAGRLISLAEANPGARAADAFPHAARANRPIFYDKQGQARSASDVYRVMVRRYDLARNNPAGPAARALAANEAPRPPASIPVPAPIGRAAVSPPVSRVPPSRVPMSRAAVAAPLASTYVAAARAKVAPANPAPMRAARPEPAAVAAPLRMASLGPARAAEAGPVFHGLFRTPGQNEAVAPVVSSLWTTPLAAADTAPVRGDTRAIRQPVSAPAAAQNGDRLLDLFQDLPPDARALFRGRV